MTAGRIWQEQHFVPKLASFPECNSTKHLIGNINVEMKQSHKMLMIFKHLFERYFNEVTAGKVES